MADKRKPPETPGGGSRRKRTAPTIDLKATEVAESPADKPETATSGPAPETPSGSETAAIPASEPVSQTTAAPGPAGEEAAKPEPKRAVPPPPPPPPPSPPPSRSAFGAGFFGGVIGALAVAAALGVGLWYGGYFPASSMQQSDVSRHIAALEKRVQALQNQPAPKLNTEALNASIGALSQRVNKIEGDFNNLPPADKAAAQRLAALDNTVRSLRDSVNALGKRTDDAATAADKAQQGVATTERAINDLQQSVQSAARGEASVATAALDALQKKVAVLETELANMRKRLDGDIKMLRGDVTSAQDKIATATASDRVARLALSATALRNAVVSGAPYAVQMAQAKRLGADAKTLAPLETFATTGVPGRNALANDLSGLIPAMRKAAGEEKPTGSILERLQANAEKLVRIRPVEAPAGNNPGDVLARIEAAAARGDISNALAELGRLPEKVRAPARDWIVRAKARQAALAAAESLAANAARALGNG